MSALTFIAGYLTGGVCTAALFYLGSAASERKAAISDPQASELDNAVAPRTVLAAVPVTLTGGRIPRARRVRRFFRSLREFLAAPRFRA